MNKFGACWSSLCPLIYPLHYFISMSMWLIMKCRHSMQYDSCSVTFISILYNYVSLKILCTFWTIYRYNDLGISFQTATRKKKLKWIKVFSVCMKLIIQWRCWLAWKHFADIEVHLKACKIFYLSRSLISGWLVPGSTKQDSDINNQTDNRCFTLYTLRLRVWEEERKWLDALYAQMRMPRSTLSWCHSTRRFYDYFCIE